MLGHVEAFDLFGSGQSHAHLSVFFVLVCIFLLHLADLGVLATLHLSLVHRIVVILLITFLVLSALFATFSSLLLIFTVALPLLIVALLPLSSFASFVALIFVLLASSIFWVVVSCFLAHLHDCNALVFIADGRSAERRRRLQDLLYDRHFLRSSIYFSLF